jgi:predicted dinucleotide-binding enzyme
MKIGIIGSGHIGGTVGTLWARAGHQVMFSSRHPEALRDLVAQAGPNARAGTPEAAAAFGEVVLVAIPFRLFQALPAGELAGKIVIDASNYAPGRDGQIDLHGRASSELVAQHLVGARLVKAFNTMYFETLRTAGRPENPDDRLVLFIAGDDAQAKQVVSQLIEEIGFAPIDTGSLHAGGLRQQPGSPIYNRPMNTAQARQALAALS